ncbi:MAG: hypothetical protein QW046_02705 [Candidatus Micrarchaeaceae archaeon]
MWKEKIREFIFEKDLDGHYNVDTDYIKGIWDVFSNLVPLKETNTGYVGKRWKILKEIEKYEQEKNSEMVRNKIMEILEIIVDQYLNEEVKSFIWPTMIKEPNLNMIGEGVENEEDIWRVLYLIYTGVKFGNYIVNVDYIGDTGRRWLWNTLVTSTTIMGRKGLDFKPIMERLKISFNPLSQPFFATLVLLQFWAVKGMEDWRKGEGEVNVEPWKKIISEKFGVDFGWSENTTLVIFGRETKGLYQAFPQSINLIKKWLNPENATLEFLNSIVNISDQQLRDLAIKKREMLVYYLLRYHNINGELLSQIIEIKCNTELKKHRGIYGIAGAKQFYRIL